MNVTSTKQTGSDVGWDRGNDYQPPDNPSRWANWFCPICKRPRWLHPAELKRYEERKAVCVSCTQRYRRKHK